MKEMKNILYKYPIIYDTDNNLLFIKNTYFPIYDNYNPDFTKIYYELVKQLYIYLPRYEESIEWSKFLWGKDLENNRIDINLLIDKYNNSNPNFKYINTFIKFIFDNYKSLLKSKQILINQENEFIFYNEEKFYQSINIPEDMINCIEELGIVWRKNHLNDKINSIELPIKHDYDYAKNQIKKIIDNDLTKSYNLVRFILKDNFKRESMYYFSKLFFNDIIKEKIIVQNLIEEIWESSDKYLINEIISKVEEWTNLSKILISLEDYNKLLNFLYIYNDNIFNNKKLLPNINDDFCKLDELFYENMANQEIKNVVLSYIDKNLNNRLLNHKIKIDNLKIRHFNNDDLIELINNFFKTSKNDSQKFYISSTILNFLPDVESTNIMIIIIKYIKNIRISE